jgi:Cu(I)/Ag(I) efflux system membrane fusion protein
MAMTRRKLLSVLAILAALAVVGSGLWYAQGRGWLEPAYHRVHHWVMGGGAATRGGGGMDMNMPGMGMDMPGMDTNTPVPGYATVTVPGEVQQRIGVEVGRVEKGPLRMNVRTVGIVQPDETRTARIHLKTEGWVEKLFVNYTGQTVRKGDPLLAIYSPQFVSTQQEYLTAHEAGRESLANDALERLQFWDVPAEAIAELKRTGKPQRNLSLQSPLSGTVLKKDVLAQEYVTPQKELYVIADLSTVWVQAKVYEYELPHVEQGQPATVTTPAQPERRFAGKVVFIQPTVDERTRTVQVRVELPNREGMFKPGEFANVTIQHTMGEGLLVPASAVIRTGEQDIAFRVLAEGRFVPVAVRISPIHYEGGRFQVLEGLKADEQVVTSANFLIDSESRLRAGGGGMAGMAGMDMSGMKGMDKGATKQDGKGGMKGMNMQKKGHAHPKE